MSSISPTPQQWKTTLHFLGTNEETYLPGTVLLRDGEMVLDIPGGSGPYLIVGRVRENAFAGVNTGRGRANVEAKWANVGGMYVGSWIEDGYEYLFSFELA